MAYVFFLAVVMSSSMAVAENCDADEVCKSQEDPGGQEKMAAALLQVHTGVAELGKLAALADTSLSSKVVSLTEQDHKAYRYVLAPAGSNVCPSGYGAISTATACQKAVQTGLDGIPESPHHWSASYDPKSKFLPSGCYKNLFNKNVHFNSIADSNYATTTTQIDLRRKICQQVHAEVAELEKHTALADTRLSSKVVSLLEQDHKAEPHPELKDIVVARPNAAAGTPDEVSFGIYAKTFLASNMKKNRFSLDYVLILKWKDPRVASILPEGVNRESLSEGQAAKSIWMPRIVVTNRYMKGYELISTVVKVHRNGDVEKVERATVTCWSIFNLEQYPFEMQHFHLKIASKEYMMDELVLKPSENASDSGVNGALFDAWQYDLGSWKVYSTEEVDGALKKSRGVLEISAKHSLDKYAHTHFIPSALLLILSFSVFWFPFMTPFVTPRMMVSILALLSFTHFMIKSSAMLPPAAPTNWNDVFNECVLELMSAAIVINIVSEVCEHQLKLPHLGQTINHEAKVLYPCHAALLLSLVLSAGKYKWISVGSAQMLARVIFSILTSGYIAYCMQRIAVFKAEHDAKEKEEQEQIAQNHAAAHNPRAGPHHAKTTTNLG